MIKRIRLMRLCFLLFFILLLGKLAYEQLYHSALLTGTLTPDSAWIGWLQQLAPALFSQDFVPQ